MSHTRQKYQVSYLPAAIFEISHMAIEKFQLILKIKIRQ